MNGKEDISRKETVSNIRTPFTVIDVIFKCDLQFEANFGFDAETVPVNLLSSVVLRVFENMGFYQETILRPTDDTIDNVTDTSFNKPLIYHNSLPPRQFSLRHRTQPPDYRSQTHPTEGETRSHKDGTTEGTCGTTDPSNANFEQDLYHLNMETKSIK